MLSVRFRVDSEKAGSASELLHHAGAGGPGEGPLGTAARILS